MRLSKELAAELIARHAPTIAHISGDHKRNGTGRLATTKHSMTDRNHPPTGVLAFDDDPRGSESSAPKLLAFEAATDNAMLAFQHTMDDFLDTQRAVMAAYAGAVQATDVVDSGARPRIDVGPVFLREPAERRPGPWAGEIISEDGDRELVTLIKLDAANDPVAHQHTIGGRRVSRSDPHRLGLPVVPFSVMAEMLAEVAARLVPDQTLIALYHVHAYKWIRYEDQPCFLEAAATRHPSTPGAVTVALYNRRQGDAERERESAVVEGIAIFGPARPAAAKAPHFFVPDAQESRFTARKLYDEQWLFHGPALLSLDPRGRHFG